MMAFVDHGCATKDVGIGMFSNRLCLFYWNFMVTGIDPKSTMLFVGTGVSCPMAARPRSARMVYSEHGAQFIGYSSIFTSRNIHHTKGIFPW